MKIGVIGLGLIGGSIFKELCLSQEHEVIGISRNVQAENVSNDYETLKTCDLVFVCTPISKTLETLDKLNEILPPETVVTDVCSVKKLFLEKKYNFKFIPSHPMAGTEHSGWENSFIGLFKGAKWVITPIDGIVIEAQDKLEQVIKTLGAEPIITTAEEHDKAVALISHLPLFVAQTLCKNIKDNKLAQTLCSSGFRDTTRLALSNLDMAEDMLNFNRENILNSLDELKTNIDELLTDNYRAEATTIKEFRQSLYD